MIDKFLDFIVDMLGREDKNIDKVQLKQELKEAIEDNKFDFIRKDGREIGFLTWIIPNNVDLVIYINNLYIEDGFRNRTNLLFLRKYFKEKYPTCKMFYWHKNKTQGYVYFK